MCRHHMLSMTPARSRATRHRGRSCVFVVMTVLSHATHGRLVHFRHLVDTGNVPVKGAPDTVAIRQAI